MKLKILGSSSKGNSYVLETEKETLMLECGIPFKDILKGLNFNLMNVAGAVVSHEHKDHSKAINDVIKNGIDVYSSNGTFKSLGISNYHCMEVKSKQQFKVGNFTIMPFDTQHDCAEPLGFLIQHNEMGKLLFITDSYYCKYNFTGLSHILIESNYSLDILNDNIEKGYIPYSLRNRIIKSHFSIEHVKDFLKATDLSKCKDITLIHLSDGNSDSKAFKKEIERLTGLPVYIAQDGLEIELMR